MGSKDCFCSDAFEIGWLQEKVVFLMQKIKELALNWVSIEYNINQWKQDTQLQLKDIDSMELDSVDEAPNNQEHFRGYNQ